MTTHPTDLDTLLKEERAKNERLEEGIAYLRGIEQRNNELIDALLARAEAAEASALTARRDGERDGLLKAARTVVEMMEAAFADAELADTPGMSEACEQAGRHYADVVDALRTLVSTVPGGEETGEPVSDPYKLGWRPIETLPHDGDEADRARCGLWHGPALFFVPEEHGGVIVAGQVDSDMFLYGPDENRCYDEMERTPTHWMPLPPPPHEMKE